MTRHTNITQIIRKPGFIAGISLLVMALLAGYANFGVLHQLVDSTNAFDTALNVANHANRFWIAIECLAMVAILDVVVALALYKVFAPVNQKLAKLVTLLRLLYAAAFMIAISQLVDAVSIATSPWHAQSLMDGTFEQFLVSVATKVDVYYLIWNAALLLFGIHLLLIGLLVYLSRGMPKLLGLLVAVAGLGYVVDSIGKLIITGYNLNVASVTFIGEVALMFWLLLKSSPTVRVAAPTNHQITRRR